jgi:hypothetical protein
MSENIRIGPLWNRTVFNARGRAVKRRGLSLAQFDDIKSLKVREYINRDEEEQLLNAHPEVQKKPREAELWAEMKSGQTLLLASLDQAGLLLQQASQAARLLSVPISTERALIGQAHPTLGRKSS